MAFPTQSIKFVVGSNQYCYINKGSSTNLYTTGDFCWESWVKFTTLPVSAASYDFMGQSWVSDGNLSFVLFLRNNGDLGQGYRARAAIANSTGHFVSQADVSGDLSITTGVWYRMAYVWTDSSHTLEFFLSNVSQGSNSSSWASGIFNGTSEFGVFNESNDGVGRFDGQAVLTRFWKTTRTSVQLAATQCTLLGSQTNLGAEWFFDGTLNDNSGNGNTLTAVNSPTFVSDVPSVCTSSAVSAVTPTLLLMNVG